jgi:hypothetical protein
MCRMCRFVGSALLLHRLFHLPSRSRRRDRDHDDDDRASGIAIQYMRYEGNRVCLDLLFLLV